MFGFLCAFRQTQWRNFRAFILNERRAVDARLAMIDAELTRIGKIQAIYETRAEAVANSTGQTEVASAVNERRVGLLVTEGSSLHKLLQAYIAQGGSPWEISLFLQPDSVEFVREVDPEEDPDDNPDIEINDREVEGVDNQQPHFGVVATKPGSRGSGGGDEGGWLTWGRFSWARAGRMVDISEAGSDIAFQVDHARRWANQSIAALNHLESKVIKLMDLREQLITERDELLTQSVGGSVDSLPVPDDSRFHAGLHVTAIVEYFDRIFYGEDANGNRSFAISNIQALAEFDVLWPDQPEDDIYHT